MSNSPTAVIEAERFRHFILSVTDYAIYTLAPDGTVTSWNAGAERFKGYTADQIIGQHFSRFYTDDDRTNDRPTQVLRQAADGRFEEEGWRVRSDGTRFWASVVIDPIRNDEGELLGFTKITRDITEQQRARQAQFASEEQFRLLVQGVTDYAIYLLAPDGTITNWNAGAERIKGFQAEEVIGTHFSRFYTPEDQADGLPMAALAQAAETGRCEREGWRVRKDGTRFLAHVVIDPIRSPTGELIGFAKVTRDITERRQAEEALARAREALFQAQKLDAIGKLTGGIAHDFNNLLNVIVNGLDMLRASGERADQLRVIDSIERAAQRGASLTQQLLAFARQQPLKPQRLQPNRIVSGFEAVLRRAVRSSISLRLEYARVLPEIVTDAAQLESALLNLVVNARDAISDSGAITIETSELSQPPSGSMLPAGRYVRIAVRDNGGGMAPDVQARALEPFFTTKAPGKGTGLGLSQVYGLMTQANGELRIESSPGMGTEVALLFPAAAEDFSAAEPPMEKVLVVDDQPDVLDMAAQLFRSLGYEVIAANNGTEALAILQNHSDIAILFSDVVMPGMNGVELAKSVRRETPGVKIILASGYVAKALLEQDREIEQFALLQKPYRLSDIIRTIKVMS